MTDQPVNQDTSKNTASTALQVVVLSGRPARTQFVLDMPIRGRRDIEMLYAPQAAEVLNTLRHQIAVAQGRDRRDAAE